MPTHFISLAQCVCLPWPRGPVPTSEWTNSLFTQRSPRNTAQLLCCWIKLSWSHFTVYFYSLVNLLSFETIWTYSSYTFLFLLPNYLWKETCDPEEVLNMSSVENKENKTHDVTETHVRSHLFLYLLAAPPDIITVYCSNGFPARFLQ